MTDPKEIEKLMRRLLAAKEIIDTCLEAAADLLGAHRPQGSAGTGPEMPPVFRGAAPKLGEDGVVEGWENSVGSDPS